MLSEHFSENEFRCKCCGELPPGGIDPILLSRLECIRALFGNKPITITSGYRCLKHNQEIKGSTGSKHIDGKAADFQIKGIKPYELYFVVEKIFHNGGIGIYKRHLHVDTGPKRRWEG